MTKLEKENNTIQSIAYWNTLRRKVEEGEHPRFFSENYSPDEMIKYCEKMIDLNKEDLNLEQ
jgi:hypothetical protein